MGELLTRYMVEVTPTRRSVASEESRIRRMVAAPMSSVTLEKLLPAHIAAYRDNRLQSVKPGTVRRELAVLRSAIERARREWGLTGDNPAACVERPKVFDERSRRLHLNEWERLMGAALSCRNPLVGPIIRFALYTGMRRGEILSLEWSNVDLRRGTAYLPRTKNGRPRTVPLSPEARDVLEGLSQRHGRVFPMSPDAVRHAWERLRQRAGSFDLRFHDLRHEALSRFSELGLNTPELASISGHRDVRMLLRYTHVQPARLAEKLARLAP